jgi:hypothetical protein
VRLNNVLKLELYVFLFVSSSTMIRAQEPVRANLQIIQDQLAQMITESGKTLLSDSSHSLVLHAQVPDHPLNGLVIKQLYQWAKTKGFASVYTDPVVRNQDRLYFMISFMPGQPRIQYQLVEGQRSKRTRQIVSQLDLVIQDPSLRIVLAETKKAAFQDIITIKEIQYIESPGLIFTYGEKPKEGVLSVLFQPLLVTVATAGIIYSFYSFRSR